MPDLTHPTPIPLLAPGATDPAAYMCSVCQSVIYPVAADAAWAARHASLCCSQVCDTCRGPKPIRGYCVPCQRARNTAAEAKLYADAWKITAADYRGPVYNSFTGHYDASVDEALERVEHDDGEPPPYLWPVRYTAQLDPDWIVEMLAEEMYEDYEVDDYAGLVAFCREWNAKQTKSTWEPDYSRVIVLGGDNA